MTGLNKYTISLREIKSALENDEFIFYYQPKVSMITGKVCGAEALIRWLKPDGQIIPPSEFIPLAESSGFITDITKAMFQKLIADIATFDDTMDDLVISMNASTKDFRDSGFDNLIHDAIEAKKVDPNMVEIELTESAILDDCDIINGAVKALVNMGIPLVMDDFGTGYSSIDILSLFPFSTIKLDRGVISRMELSDRNRTIVEASIRMGHQLQLEVIAEGIENETVYRCLQSSGCAVGQGYWISPPPAIV